MNHDPRHVEVLERYTELPVQGHEEDWKQLMQMLELQLGHWESVQTVLRQGSWRTANDPLRYIRTASLRENRKIDNPKRPRALAGCISEMKLPCNRDGSPMEHDEAIDLLNTVIVEGDPYTDYAKARVHPRFLIADSHYEDATHTIDYSKVMDEVALIASLNKRRRESIEKVLCLLQVAHFTRNQLLGCADEEWRKRLQAGLKWIDRNTKLLAKVMSEPPSQATCSAQKIQGPGKRTRKGIPDTP